MRMLVVHDNAGCLLYAKSDYPGTREPVGVPFLWVEIPTGKQIKIIDGIGVDVSVTPHQVILEDIPKSELEIVNERLAATEEALLLLILEGGGF